MSVLVEGFKGDIVTSSDSDYLDAISRWASNAVRRAKVVAYVRDESDIGLALRYAKANSLPVAVRGGGHSPAGASSVKDGLVIDLSRYLRGVRVDPEHKLAYVQGGAIWETVDKATMEYGLATVGGTVDHTGVGGLITGGGYGWLSGQHGLAIDNLLQATVVTADGSVLTASQDENPDLFFGIRGGGSNFGVITEFVLRLHPQRPTVFAGMVMYAREQVEVVGKVLKDWYATVKPEEGIHAVFTRGPDDQPYLVLVLFYSGSEAEGRENFEAFFNIEYLMDGTTEIPYQCVNSMMNHTAIPGRPCYMRGALRAPPEQCITRENFDAYSRITDVRAAVMLEFISQNAINRINGSTTPYRRDLPGNAVVIVHWEGDTDEVPARARDVASELADMVKAPGLAYGNYNPDSDPDAPAMPRSCVKAEELFGDNYARLQKIKRKYDPDVVFNRWFVVTPSGC